MTSNTVTTERPLTRDEAGALFSRAMGLVAVTAATFALGAYLARDVTAGWGWLFLIAPSPHCSACTRLCSAQPNLPSGGCSASAS